MQGDMRGFALARDSGLGCGARNTQVAALNRANLTEITTPSGGMLIGSRVWKWEGHDTDSLELAESALFFALATWPLTFPWFTTARYSDVGSQEGWLRYRQIFLPPVQGEGLFQTFETRINCKEVYRVRIAGYWIWYRPSMTGEWEVQKDGYYIVIES